MAPLSARTGAGPPGWALGALPPTGEPREPGFGVASCSMSHGRQSACAPELQGPRPFTWISFPGWPRSRRTMEGRLGLASSGLRRKPSRASAQRKQRRSETRRRGGFNGTGRGRCWDPVSLVCPSSHLSSLPFLAPPTACYGPRAGCFGAPSSLRPDVARDAAVRAGCWPGIQSAGGGRGGLGSWPMSHCGAGCGGEGHPAGGRVERRPEGPS